MVSLSKDEIRLRDGRVIRGTLVGGQIKAKTALGEIAVKVDELQFTGRRAGARRPRSHRRRRPPGGDGGTSPGPDVDAGAPTGRPARFRTAYPRSPPTRTARRAGRATSPRFDPGGAAHGVESGARGGSSSVLYRDALFSSSQVGQVAAGQQVRYVDSIDRRLGS